MRDEWGFPEHMFGEADEVFFGAMGRLTMLAAILDVRLLDLLNSLLPLEDRDKYAGAFGHELVLRCSKEASKLPGPAEGDTWGLRKEAGDLLHDCEQAQRRRNEFVHSAWPNPRLDSAFAWRSLKAAQRRVPDEVRVSFTTNREGLLQIIGEFCRLIDKIGWLLPIVDWNRNRRMSNKLC